MLVRGGVGWGRGAGTLTAGLCSASIDYRSHGIHLMFRFLKISYATWFFYFSNKNVSNNVLLFVSSVLGDPKQLGEGDGSATRWAPKLSPEMLLKVREQNCFLCLHMDLSDFCTGCS